MNKLPKEAVEAYEVISHTNKTSVGGVIGYIWWTGKSTKCSIKSLTLHLKHTNISGVTITDGYDFFKKLPIHIRGGYVSLKKVL